MTDAASIQGSPTELTPDTTKPFDEATHTGPAPLYDYARTGPVTVRVLISIYIPQITNCIIDMYVQYDTYVCPFYAYILLTYVFISKFDILCMCICMYIPTYIQVRIYVHTYVGTVGSKILLCDCLLNML